jgi:hypothetical protein
VKEKSTFQDRLKIVPSVSLGTLVKNNQHSCKSMILVDELQRIDPLYQLFLVEMKACYPDIIITIATLSIVSRPMSYVGRMAFIDW